MKHKQVLTFDGGGIKGVASTTWLSKLVKEKVLNLDNVFAVSGTSTGSIIAAALAKPNPFSPDDITELYRELSPKIFKRPWWTPKILDVIVFSAPYDIRKLEDALKYHFGNTKVGDCPRKFVIPIWDLFGMHRGERASTVLMVNNFSGGVYEEYLDWPLYKVLAGSSAAPTYFKPMIWQDSLGKKHMWTDGGQVDNTALLSSLVTLFDKYFGAQISPDDLAVLSFGNGYKFQFEDPDKKESWATPRMIRSLINAIVQTNQLLGLTTSRRILFSNFRRCNFRLDSEPDLDDYRLIDKHIEWAKNCDLSEDKKWLKAFFI